MYGVKVLLSVGSSCLDSGDGLVNQDLAEAPDWMAEDWCWLRIGGQVFEFLMEEEFWIAIELFSPPHL